MYIYNSLPIIFTLPIAFYFHTHPPPSKFHQAQNVDTHLNGQHRFKLQNDLLSQLLEKTFGREGRLNLFLFDKMTQKFHSLNKGKMLDLWWIVTAFTSHTLFALASLFIYEHTVLGVCCKIVVRKMSRSSKLLLMVTRKALNRENILQRADSMSSTNEDELDLFVECEETFENRLVAREESIPKANHKDEKMLENNSDPLSSNDINESMQVEKRKDSGVIVPNASIGTMVSNVDLVEKSTETTTEELISAANMMVLNSTLAYGIESSPEKFKRFLHERNEDVDRLGISFDEGYLDESDTDLSNENDRSRLMDIFDLSSLGETVMEKISLLV
eukprot:TCONS_00010031-protein